jgi:hypothetical protein
VRLRIVRESTLYPCEQPAHAGRLTQYADLRTHTQDDATNLRPYRLDFVAKLSDPLV